MHELPRRSWNQLHQWLERFREHGRDIHGGDASCGRASQSLLNYVKQVIDPWSLCEIERTIQISSDSLDAELERVRWVGQRRRGDKEKQYARFAHGLVVLADNL